MIKVTDAYAQALADDARREARNGAGWLMGLAVLTTGAVLLAVHGLPGVADWLLWIVVGFVGGDLIGSVPGVWRAARTARDLRRCPVCRAAAVGMDELDQRWGRCARRGHRADGSDRPVGGAR